MATKKTTAKKGAARRAAPAKATAKKAAPTKRLDAADHIKANNKLLGAAVVSGDAKAAGRMYTANAKLMPPNANLCRGIKAITAFWQSALDLGVRSAVLKSAEVEQLGSTAIEVGTYVLKDGAGSLLDQGKYLVVWKKDRGVWKLHRDIFNSSVAASA